MAVTRPLRSSVAASRRRSAPPAGLRSDLAQPGDRAPGPDGPPSGGIDDP